jgi:hypothetical protein
MNDCAGGFLQFSFCRVAAPLFVLVIVLMWVLISSSELSEVGPSFFRLAPEAGGFANDIFRSGICEGYMYASVYQNLEPTAGKQKEARPLTKIRTQSDTVTSCHPNPEFCIEIVGNSNDGAL